MVKDSFLNWGFKPSINTDVFTEGGYQWGGYDTECEFSLYFEIASLYRNGHILDQNYNRPQGNWYFIEVYLLAEGLISHRKKDHEFPVDMILVSQAMINDWVKNNAPAFSKGFFMSATEENTKQLVFDNMDKVLIKSRGDFPA
jgi:hypothetical protein